MPLLCWLKSISLTLDLYIFFLWLISLYQLSVAIYQITKCAYVKRNLLRFASSDQVLPSVRLQDVPISNEIGYTRNVPTTRNNYCIVDHIPPKTCIVFKKSVDVAGLYLGLLD